MKCIIKSLLLSTFALFAVLFGSCIITSKNVSAVADISITVSSGVYHSDVFSNCSSSCLNSYKYLIVSGLSTIGGSSFILQVPRTPSNSLYSDFYIGGWNRYDDSSNFSSIYTLPFSSDQSNSFIVWGSNYTFSSPVTLTLTESYQSCPTCPEIPDNPYDPKFDEIKQAILIIPATALVIYFFFCIYRMLLKGRE